MQTAVQRCWAAGAGLDEARQESYGNMPKRPDVRVLQLILIRVACARTAGVPLWQASRLPPDKVIINTGQAWSQDSVVTPLRLSLFVRR